MNNLRYLKKQNRIEKIRYCFHLTRKELSEKSGISENVLFRIEKNYKQINVDYLKKIAAVLNVTENYLLED